MGVIPLNPIQTKSFETRIDEVEAHMIDLETDYNNSKADFSPYDDRLTIAEENSETALNNSSEALALVDDNNSRLINLFNTPIGKDLELQDIRFDDINNIQYDSAGDRINKINSDLNDNENKSVSTISGSPAIAYACVLRNDGSGWGFISDDVHKPINLGQVVETVNNEIGIVYNTSATKVGSLVACPDETLASYGLTCGASVGKTSAYIKCYAPFTGFIDGLGSVSINPWFNGEYSVTPYGDGTGYYITYSGASDINNGVMITPVRDGSAPHSSLSVYGARTSTTVALLRAESPLYAYMSYSGSTWNIATSCVANVSASFDNGTGILTITHDAEGTQSGYNRFQNAHIDMKKNSGNALIHARIVEVTASTIQVSFYNSSGTLMMSPTTDMRLMFSRPNFIVPHTWSNNARAYFDLGYALVKPSKLISTSGNIWVYGMHNK